MTESEDMSTLDLRPAPGEVRVVFGVISETGELRQVTLSIPVVVWEGLSADALWVRYVFPAVARLRARE